MGDHMAVFRSLRELFPQVDPRMLKAVAIEHQKDVDTAVVAVLDEVMPSMIDSVGTSCAHPKAAASMPDSVGTSSANHSTREVGSSSSAGHGVRLDEANGSSESAQRTSSTEAIVEMQENVMVAGSSPSYRGMSEQLNFSYTVPELNVEQRALDDLSDLFKRISERNSAHSDNEVGSDEYLSEYIVQPLMGESSNGSINLNVAPDQERHSNSTTAIGDSLGKYYADINNSFWSNIFTGVPSSDVSFGVPSMEKDAFVPVLDSSVADMGESSVDSAGVLEQKDTNSAGIDYSKQQSEDRVEHEDPFLSSKTVLLPDLNSNHFASLAASTQSSYSVSMDSLEDSIAVAKNNKNDLVPSLELVTKMIGDAELLEEKAKMAKRESSVSGSGILTKVEELKEMLNHAKEANDMHAGEVFGEKSILTTEARELQSRLQRLSDERDSYLAVIEEIRQTLEVRLVAAQEEIEAAEKEKNEKEASAQALLSEQEKEMNSIVEISRNLQREAEENSKLKDFLVERGRIVDTLQGEMAVICEDVSQLKRIVDERLSWSKLQRSTMSSLSSSLHKSGSSSDRTLHSSLHKSETSSTRTVEAVKHTVAESASPVVEDRDVNERTVEMLDACRLTDEGNNSKERHSNEDGWEILLTEDEEWQG